MTESKQKKRCLILIPQNRADEPKWNDEIMPLVNAEKIKLVKGTTIGNFYCDESSNKKIDGDKAVCVYVLAYPTCQKLIKINDYKTAKDLFLKLHEYFYEKEVVPVGKYAQAVFCGHFNVDIAKVRDFFEEALRTATEEEKKKLRRFEDPIMGRGNFIIDSYTLGATVPWNVGATDLINKLKEAKKKEEVKSLFRGIFDFFWYQHKLPELITNMEGQLFMCGQSEGKYGIKEFQASVAEFKECEEILKDEYEVKEDLSLIYKLAKPSNQELNHEEIKEVDTQLDRILLAILKKRDGEKSATKIEG
jgi:hypothetical protein